ncbi:MAG: MltA domain-containing protein [Hyphomicrobiales bacterium]
MADPTDHISLVPAALEATPPGGDEALRIPLQAFQRQAREILERGAAFQRPVLFGGQREDWLSVCNESLTAGSPSAFFLKAFRPYRVQDESDQKGLFTGYFEPEAEGSRVPTGEFCVPIYRKPADLVALPEQAGEGAGLRYGRMIDGKAAPYLTREEIEKGALAGRGLEICYLRSWVDAFFIHIQGSGRVRLPDGKIIRLSYAAKSGLPYTGIGAVLVGRGELTRETASMQSLKAWMAAHAYEARALMWHNKSFVFFREIDVADASLGAVGAAGANLTPLHSMAVDRSLWMFGMPAWIETAYPPECRRPDPTLNRMMIAQDTGSAIKGAVRGDFYWGWGDEAALIAGHMKSPGRMTVLLPHAVALRLGLPR